MKMRIILAIFVLVLLTGCGAKNPYVEVPPNPAAFATSVVATNAVITPIGRTLSPEERDAMFPPGTIPVKLCSEALVYNRMEENANYYLYTIPATAEFKAYGISDQWVTASVNPPQYIKRSTICL